jgi:hypothetical protein
MYIIVTSVTIKLYIYIIDEGKMIATYTITYTLPVDICSVSFREIVIPNCLDIFFFGGWGITMMSKAHLMSSIVAAI